jgi:hypothetical protein
MGRNRREIVRRMRRHLRMSEGTSFDRLLPIHADISEIGSELVYSALPKRPDREGAHDHPDLKQWKAIHTNVKQLLSVRSRIAHHPAKGGAALCYINSNDIVPMGTSVSLNEARFTRVDLLNVSAAEGLRGKHKTYKPLRTADLDVHYSAVKSAAESLSQFRTSKLQTHLKLSSRTGSKPLMEKSPEADRPIEIRIPPRS